jgi:hypothetical protein
MKNPSDRIKMLWDVILKLIDEKGERQEYIAMSPNKLMVEWRGE